MVKNTTDNKTKATGRTEKTVTAANDAATHNNSGSTPRQRRKKRRKLRKGLFKGFIILFLLCILIGSAGTAAYVAHVLKDLPEWDESVILSDKTTFLYDHDGQVFSQLHSSENRTYVNLDDMPQYLIDCFIATEDTRFYEHKGIDIIRIGGALIADIKAGGTAQGASTITMQLARTAILNDQDKKLARKIKEAVLAMQLEKKYSKDEILALYLNEIYFGHSAYGVQAASQTIFGKDVSDISMAEAATLVGIIRNPKLYSPLNNPENSFRVKNQVLTNLSNYFGDTYTAEEIAAAKEDVIETGEYAYTASYNHPWYTDYVISQTEDILGNMGYSSASIYTSGLRIYTTLNDTVQTLMEEAYSSKDNFPETYSADLVESAMVVLDAQDNAILGLVGGREYTTKRGYSRATDMTRQPGSTFKPIADYAPAIEAGYSPATVANDVATTFGTTWQPRNYDGSYRGIISMRTACQYSVNIASVKFLQMATVPSSLKMLGKMGIALSEQDNNLSIGLGGLTYGVSPLQMAAAYGTLANSGIYTEPWCISRIEDSDGKVIYESSLNQTIAMKETTAYLVTDMLKSVTQAGTGTRAQLSNRDVASKTGTVQLPDLSYFKGLNGNRDAWFAAFTPEMVGVVWMGYDHDKDENGTVQYLRQIYGGKYPAQIWKYVIGGASKDLPASRFIQPSGIVSLTVDKYTGMLPNDKTLETVTEIFDKDHVPTSSGDQVQWANICEATKQLASDNCPETRMIFRMTEPAETNKVSGDTPLPTTICPTHGTPSGNPGNTVDTGNDYNINNNDHNNYNNYNDHSTADNNSDDSSNTSSGNDYIPVGTLSSPSNILLDSRNSSAVYISWEDSNSGSLKYQVEFWSGSNSSSTITTYFTDLTVSNLTPDTTYHFRVRTLTDAEDNSSPWSSPQSITTMP